jgi:hypothetical protein
LGKAGLDLIRSQQGPDLRSKKEIPVDEGVI